MAARYWVGGGASVNWNATAPTNWAATSGGANNQSVPGSADDVFYDAGSSAPATWNVQLTLNSIDMAGYTGTVTVSNSAGFTHAGSGTICRFPSGGSVVWGGTCLITFTGTSGTTLLYSNGKILGCGITINAPGCTIQLQDNLDITGANSWVLTLTLGTFDANDFDVRLGQFTSATTGTRTLSMGNGTWYLGSTFASASASWNTGTITGLTFNKEGADIVFVPAGYAAQVINVFSGGALTFNNLTIHGSDNPIHLRTVNFQTASTFDTLTFDSTLGPLMVNIGTSNSLRQTCNAFEVIAPSQPIVFFTTAPHTAVGPIVAAGTVSVDNVVLCAIAASGGATFIATNSYDLGSNSGWTITPPVSELGTEVWDTEIEAGASARELLRLMGSVLVGKVSGAGSGIEVFREAVADSKPRITATIDSAGNRTAITADTT